MGIRVLLSLAVCHALSISQFAGSASDISFSNGPSAAATASRPETGRGDDLQIVTKETKTQSKIPNCSIDARFPQIVGADERRGAKFNLEVTDLIEKRIAGFKSQVSQTNGPSGNSAGASLTIDYHTTFSNGRLLSVAFSTESHLAGSRHPNLEALALTYDLQAGAGLTMADIFRPGADFLRVMAEFCIPKLTEQLGQNSDHNWIKRGASATAENYKVWNLTKTGMLITFDTNQVAPGVRKVIVPFNTLRPLIATGSPVYQLT
jgi:hypothetical protein